MQKRLLCVFAIAWALSTPVYGAQVGSAAKAKALAHYIMAVSHDFNGRIPDAVREYERSIALNPNEVLPYLRLSAYYLRLSLFDKAVKQLKNVLWLDPENTQAHYLLGLLYSSQKKFDLAAAEYEHILKTASSANPENLEIYTYLAQLYFSQGKYAQAIEQFKRIVSIKPKEATAFYYLGLSYVEVNDQVKAREAFLKAISINPDHDGALNSLAFMYAESGQRLDEALRLIQKAIAVAPVNGAYYDTLGWVYFKQGAHSQALIALQKALVYVQDPIIYDHLGDVYHAVKEFALAYKHWQKSLDLDANQPRIKAKVEAIQKNQAFKAQM